MIVLDTTVLVYAKGSGHPLFEIPAASLSRAIADGRLVATTTVEVIQEFAHVRARRHGRTDAAGLAHDCAERLTPLLAAAAISSAATLVSADIAFADLPDLAHVVPDISGVRRLLQSPPDPRRQAGVAASRTHPDWPPRQPVGRPETAGSSLAAGAGMRAGLSIKGRCVNGHPRPTSSASRNSRPSVWNR